jgi:hypothetical protein
MHKLLGELASFMQDFLHGKEDNWQDERIQAMLDALYVELDELHPITYAIEFVDRETGRIRALDVRPSEMESMPPEEWAIQECRENEDIKSIKDPCVEEAHGTPADVPH